MTPIATESNRKSTLNNTNIQLLKGSFYEPAQTVENINLNIQIPNKSKKNREMLILYSPQRYEKMTTPRIQKKITEMNNNIFRNSRYLPTFNAPPFDKNQKCDWNHLTRDILSMSPLMKEKKKYYLSDIMKSSYSNNLHNIKTKVEIKENESIKEIRKKNDELNMKEFMNRFANPAYRKYICEKMKINDNVKEKEKEDNGKGKEKQKENRKEKK